MQGQSQTLSCLFIPVDTTWTYPKDVILILVQLGPSCELWFCFHLLVEVPLCCCCHQRPVMFCLGPRMLVPFVRGCAMLLQLVHYCRWWFPASTLCHPIPASSLTSIPSSPFFHTDGFTDSWLGSWRRLPYTLLRSHCRGIFHLLPAMFVLVWNHVGPLASSFIGMEVNGRRLLQRPDSH